MIYNKFEKINQQILYKRHKNEIKVTRPQKNSKNAHDAIFLSLDIGLLEEVDIERVLNIDFGLFQAMIMLQIYRKFSF